MNDSTEKQARIDNFNERREVLLKEGYNETAQTISILKANLMAFVTAGPLALLCGVAYIVRWRHYFVGGSFNFRSLLIGYLFFMLLLVVSIFIHEGLHGLVWGLFCKEKYKSIHISMNWRMLTPYCHCKEPLCFSSYILGGLAPLIVLGFGTFAASMFIRSSLLIFLSAMNILCAGGDTTVACMLLKYRKKDAVIIDHPTDCGFYAYTK